MTSAQHGPDPIVSWLGSRHPYRADLLGWLTSQLTRLGVLLLMAAALTNDARCTALL